jgi:hypothetical protein
MKRLLMVAALVCAGLLPAAPAAGDTPGCVSRGEYDNTERFLSTGQIAGRYDTNGYYDGSGPERFRRAYPACWSDGREVVVWYSLNTGLSDDWAVRDR